MKRKAAVAGSFYPKLKNDLISTIEECFLDKEFGPGKSLEIGSEKTERKILGGVCPHAGYVYSGAATANTMQAIFSEGVPDTIIILGTQHTGYYSVSAMVSGEWETPLGNLEIDSDLAKMIVNDSNIIINDESAFFGFPHGREHCIEVQLPWLKYASIKSEKEIKIVPITVGVMKIQKLQEIGDILAKSINKQPAEKQTVIIASSDMTHKSCQNYNNPSKDLQEQEKADEKVINSIKEYDWNNTFKNALATTVCGPQTITTAMVACKNLGATSSDVLKYYNSYQKMGGKGPCEYSVGYLSAVFQK